MPLKTNRQAMRDMIARNPDISNHEIAAALGITIASVRGSLSAMKLSRHQPNEKGKPAPWSNKTS